MIQDTSLEAWHNLQDRLGYAQKQVLAAITQYPNSSNAEIANILDWQINRITGRTNELRKLGLVEDGGKRKDKITGSTAHVWRIKPPIQLPPAFKVAPKETKNQLS